MGLARRHLDDTLKSRKDQPTTRHGRSIMSTTGTNWDSARKTTNVSRPLSWIPPEIAWTSTPDLIGLKVAVDFQLIEFIASGRHESVLLPADVYKSVDERDLNAGWLHKRLEVVANAQALLRPPLEYSDDEIKTVILHLHGVFALPCSRECLVLISRESPSHSDGWLSEGLRKAAIDICEKYNSARDAYDADYAKWAATRPPPYADGLARLAGFLHASNAPAQPTIDHAWKMALCRRAVVVGSRRKVWSRQLERRSLSAIAQCGWAPSRDGFYEGILPIVIGRERGAVVMWEPYQGLPAYPEVRWCVQRRLPRALRKPRLTQPARDMNDGMVIRGIANEAANLVEVLQDAHHDFPLEDLGGPIHVDGRNRIENVRKQLIKTGFEAIAWFQPYHVWCEETWGIYFDAPKLDDLALSLLEDFREKSIRADRLVAPMAFGLVHAHELFHARVEAALSWMEINAGRPRHLRYKDNVYRKTFGHSECLEEALANWSSWQWYMSYQADFVGDANNLEQFDLVIKGALDMSPPGYRDWRVGHDDTAWKTLATQMATGSLRAPPRGMSLPLDSTLKGPLPYDFRADDIPVRFSGSGIIANCLLSHPATLNVPSLSEMKKALRHFDYRLVPSKGKGSHQKWIAPNLPFVTLPTRNPVSRKVFQTFLENVGIDKNEYIAHVRPML